MVFGYIDAAFIDLSIMLGIPDDQLKLAFTWLICIPLGQLNRLLNDPLIRNLYSLILGMFLSYLCIKEFLYICLGTSLLVYIIVKIRGRQASIPSFIAVFAILLACHTYRYHYDYMGWRLDGTTSLMLMLCKMIYFAFFYSDGKIKECPSLLEYLGYIYFYPSAIIGPAFDYESYHQFIHKKEQYANLPSTLMASLKQALIAAIYLFILIKLTPLINTNFFKQEWYLNMNIIGKIVVAHIVGMVIRCKYFAGWKFAQAGINSTGISYNGLDEKTKEAKFDRILTMQNSYEIEPNPKLKTEMWNTSVQVWLRRCFFERIAKIKGPNVALLCTFIVSAIWHGVHPIYYFGFLHWALCIECTRFIYKAREKFSWIPKHIRTVLVVFLGESSIEYMAMGIVLLDWNIAMEYYRNQYFFGTIGPILVYAFFKLTNFGQGSSSSAKGKKPDTKAAAAEKTD